MSLDKILRLSKQDTTPPGDDLRELARAAHLALSEAAATSDPAHAAELVYAALTATEGLSGMLYADGMDDWVEATSAPADGILLSGKEPYGSDAGYADPGYQADGKKRYPTDTSEHTRAAWSYINMTKNAKAYTAQQLAKIKAKIKGAMGSHGIGANVVAASAGEDPAVMARLAAGMPMPSVPMSHGPINGSHSHAHTVTMTHEHEHTHAGDNSHGGSVHGSNAGQKSWAAKGSAGWASHRQDW